jgi:hypothetical protein
MEPKTIEEQYVYRCLVAVVVSGMLRNAIEANNNLYHGGLVPNLTSVQDVLTMPFAMLYEQTQRIPDMGNYLTPDALQTLREVLLFGGTPG